jgi:hypothetical protein
MRTNPIYPGIQQDVFGGMTDIGGIIKDAWALGLLPESETCEGWPYAKIQQLYDQVSRAWEPHGHLVSRLPPELKERYLRIQGQALQRARELGWEPPMESDD